MVKGLVSKHHSNLIQLREEILQELRRLQNIIPVPCANGQNVSLLFKRKEKRNLEELQHVFEQLGLAVIPHTNNILIKKKSGDFLINFINGNIFFTPRICIECTERKNCKYMKNNNRKLCIIANSRGWANVSFSDTDLLILAKIYAILFDMLPNHVVNQIKSMSGCFNTRHKMQMLSNTLIQSMRNNDHHKIKKVFDSQVPAVPGPLPPPENVNTHLQFTPPPRNLKYVLSSSNMIKARSDFLKELKYFFKLLQLSRMFTLESDDH
ncbi:MAG: hypothetical protein ACTSRS_02400 [Candidatus Helarchaeota archaeon]